ncbi:unnamed protein product [Rotaria sp. Silwood2]|nr:unnamed protein product [Rotaria sp. Silwood2]CAF3419759.1 unnamed protein product [Rotaria sp. Silwood2]CAF4578692.1 unnamed protein product [Rotaria sp. Silwood2]
MAIYAMNDCISIIKLVYIMKPFESSKTLLQNYYTNMSNDDKMEEPIPEKQLSNTDYNNVAVHALDERQILNDIIE